MAEVPTIRIKNPSDPDEFIIINEADFNPDIHEPFDGESAEPPEDEEPIDEESEEEADEAAVAEIEEAPEETPTEEPGEDEYDEAEEAVDLREVPVSEGRLEAAVAEIEDIELLQTMFEADDRSSAKPVYEARIAELSE